MTAKRKENLVVLTTRLTPSAAERLRQIAAQDDRTPSQVARRWLTDRLANEAPKAGAQGA